MNYRQDGNTFKAYVKQNEKIMQTLTDFCKGHNIQNAQISGIGAIKQIELGAYDLNNKKYIIQNFDETWELTSFQGNVMLKGRNPFIHAHINISDHNFNVKGGHLFEATVAVVGEFVLKKINSKGKREFDPNIGLACMSFN